MDECSNPSPIKDVQADVLIMAEKSFSNILKDLKVKVLPMAVESDSPTCGRSFGHCIVTWEIKNYGRALWENNFKIGTPEFSIKGPKAQDTKWKLTLKTESNHKSLVEELKVNIGYKAKEKSFDSLLKEPSKLEFGKELKGHEKEKFDLTCSLIDKLTDSELPVKNLMLHLERAKSDDGPSRVWVDWKVCYIGITGEKYPLAHEEHIFTKRSGYVFNIGTLYDFEKDFEYNSGVMTILCEMIVKDVDTDIRFHDDMNIDLHGLSEDLQWIFYQRKFCDAEINVDGKKIKVHKALLCSHSKYFESLFKSEDIDVIEMPGMKYDEIVKILEYMYSYDIKDVVENPSLSLAYSVNEMNLKDLAEHYVPEEVIVHTIIDIRKLTFPWNIQDFSTLELKCISSSILSSGIDEGVWQIHLYPRGTDGNSEYITIHVECIEGDIPDDLCIQCAVIRENGKVNVWKTLRNSVESRTVFKNDEFIERDNALKLLSNDSLRIGLKVRTCIGKKSSIVYKPCTPVLYSMKKSFENMVSNMLSLQQSNKYTDVVLKFEKEEIKAHRFILSARSHLLARKLQNANSISFPKVSPTIFKILLDYMYCAILSVTDIDTIIDVYKAAEEFVIPRLQEKCSRILQESVTLDKVCNILRLADEYCDEYLKSTALEFVKVNENMFKEHILEKIERNTYLLWCGREKISKKNETLSVKSLVKTISVTKCTEDSILTYNFEIDPETISVRDSQTEQIGEESRTSVDSTTNESIQSSEQVSETLKVSSAREEMSSIEPVIQKPIACEMNIKSKMPTNKFDVPLKKRYRDETEFSKSSEESEVLKQVPQSPEMRKIDEQSKVDLLKTSKSPSESRAKGKPDSIKTGKSPSKSPAKGKPDLIKTGKSPSKSPAKGKPDLIKAGKSPSKSPAKEKRDLIKASKSPSNSPAKEKRDLIKASKSPSKSPAKEKQNQTACEIKSDSEQENRTDEISSSKSP